MDAKRNGYVKRDRDLEKRIDPNSLPPCSPETERLLIGALLIPGDGVLQVQGKLRPDDFFTATHRNIYTAALAVFNRQQGVDIGTVRAELDSMGLGDEDGYRFLDLSRMIDECPTHTNALAYAEVIEAKGTARRMLAAVGTISKAVYDHDGDPAAAIEEGTQAWVEATTRQGVAEARSLREMIGSFIESTEARQDGDLFATSEAARGVIVPTEIPGLDRLLGGQHPHDFLVLGARPGLGKTSLLTKLALNAAHAGCPAGLFSLEMGYDQMINRVVATEARVDVFKLRTGQISQEEWQRVKAHCLEQMAELPIYIDCAPRLTITDLRARALRMKYLYGIQWLGVDYLQLLRAPSANGRGSRFDEVGEVSMGLKALANELGIPVVVAAQLNRKAAEQTAPSLEHLGESGQIERDGDVIILLHTDVDDDEVRRAGGTPDPVITVQAHVAKHRNGPVGTVALRFDRRYTRFDALDTQHEAQGR